VNDPFRRANTGERLDISAQAWNAMLEAVRARSLGRSEAAGVPQALAVADRGGDATVLVRNDSGSDRSRFDVLGVASVIFGPADNLAEFQDNAALAGAVPAAASHKGRFAVLLEPIPAGVIGRAALNGLVVARLNVSAAADAAGIAVADVKDGDATQLDLQAGGTAQVLWRESGTGTKWALLRLGGGTGGAGGGTALEVKEADGAPDLTGVGALVVAQADGGYLTQPAAGQAQLNWYDATRTQKGMVNVGSQSWQGAKVFYPQLSGPGGLPGAGWVNSYDFSAPTNPDGQTAPSAYGFYEAAGQSQGYNWTCTYLDPRSGFVIESGYGAFAGIDASQAVRLTLDCFSQKLVLSTRPAGGGTPGPGLYAVTDAGGVVRNGATASTGGLSFTGGLFTGGAIAFPYAPAETCEGRLTPLPNAPVPATDLGTVTALYWVPCRGNRVGLYDGTTWTVYTFSGLTLDLSGLAASTAFDVFLYWNGSAVAIEAVPWAGLTSRNFPLATQDGVLVKSGAPGHRYVGSFATTGTAGQTESSRRRRLVWNHYNRVRLPFEVRETTPSWLWPSAAWRIANNAANYAEVVIGWEEDALDARVLGLVSSPTATPCAVGVGLDGNWTANAARLFGDGANGYGPSGAAVPQQTTAFWSDQLAAGYHQIGWLEYGGATTTWYGQAGAWGQAGLLGTLLG